MINLSSKDTIENLITQLDDLESPADLIEANIFEDARRTAISLLWSTKTETLNGASLNFRIGHLPALVARQVEIQITGRKI